MKNNSFNQTASFRLVSRGKGGGGEGGGRSHRECHAKGGRELARSHCTIVDTSGKLARILPKEIEGLWAGLDLVLLKSWCLRCVTAPVLVFSCLGCLVNITRCDFIGNNTRCICLWFLVSSRKASPHGRVFKKKQQWSLRIHLQLI